MHDHTPKRAASKTCFESSSGINTSLCFLSFFIPSRPCQWYFLCSPHPPLPKHLLHAELKRTHHPKCFYFWFSSRNTNVLEQIVTTPVKSSTAGFPNAGIARGELQHGGIKKHLCRQQQLGFGSQIQHYPLQSDRKNSGWSVQQVWGFQTLCCWHIKTLQSDQSKVENESLIHDNYMQR